MLQRSSLLPVTLLVLLGTSWGLRVSLIKLAAESRRGVEPCALGGAAPRIERLSAGVGQAV